MQSNSLEPIPSASATCMGLGPIAGYDLWACMYNYSIPTHDSQIRGCSTNSYIQLRTMHMHSDCTNINMPLHVRVCVGSYVAG